MVLIGSDDPVPRMAFNPEILTKSLADTTRLRLLMLLHAGRELCVCELTAALELPQPKISRHLAILREAEMLLDRRVGTWVYYRIHPNLPAWAREALAALATGSEGETPFAEDRQRLAAMSVGSAASCS